MTTIDGQLLQTPAALADKVNSVLPPSLEITTSLPSEAETYLMQQVDNYPLAELRKELDAVKQEPPSVHYSRCKYKRFWFPVIFTVQVRKSSSQGIAWYHLRLKRPNVRNQLDFRKRHRGSQSMVSPHISPSSCRHRHSRWHIHLSAFWIPETM